MVFLGVSAIFPGIFFTRNLDFWKVQIKLIVLHTSDGPELFLIIDPQLITDHKRIIDFGVLHNQFHNCQICQLAVT